jgi:hypothetical protein
MPAADELAEENAIASTSSAAPCGRTSASVNERLTPGESAAGVTVVEKEPLLSVALATSVAVMVEEPEPRLSPETTRDAKLSRRSEKLSADWFVAAKHGVAADRVPGVRSNPSFDATSWTQSDELFHSHESFAADRPHGMSWAHGSSRELFAARDVKRGGAAERMAVFSDKATWPTDTVRKESKTLPSKGGIVNQAADALLAQDKDCEVVEPPMRPDPLTDATTEAVHTELLPRSRPRLLPRT